jgi:hypothetical protein
VCLKKTRRNRRETVDMFFPFFFFFFFVNAGESAWGNVKDFKGVDSVGRKKQK